MATQIQVLLREDVDHLGYKGDLVEVRKGYWRNFLQPQRKAELATAGMVAELTARMERRRLARAESVEEAKELRDMLERTTVTVTGNAGPQGKLYGSISAEQIVRALESVRRMRLDPKLIDLDEPIKSVGTHKVPVKLHGGIRAELETIVEAREVGADHPDARAAAAEEAAAAAAAAAEAGEGIEPGAAEDAADAAEQADAAADATADA